MKAVSPPAYQQELIYGCWISLDDAENFLAECARIGLETRIFDDKNEFDDLKEVVTVRGERPIGLQLEGYSKQPYTRLKLKGMSGGIMLTNEGRGEAENLWFRLKDLYSKSISWDCRVLNPKSWTTIGAFSGLLVFLGWLLQITQHRATPALLAIAFFVGAYSVAAFGVFWRFYRAGIRLRRRHEGGFFKRNSDKILLSLLSVVVGAILGGLITELVHRALSTATLKK